MRTVGHRQSEPLIESRASSEAFARGLAVVDAAATFGWAKSTGQTKGVYRFKTFEAMEEHRLQCLAQAMAEQRAKRMRHG
jgi:hypothetical protein